MPERWKPGQPLREWGPGPEFAADVGSLGRKTYPNTFTGIVMQPDGSIAIYVSGTETRAFIAAVESLPDRGVPWTLHQVAHGHAFLRALTRRIADDGDVLRSAGIALGSWGPDVSTGLVSVQLVEPFEAQIDVLAAKVGLPPSEVSAGYQQIVEGMLQARYGRDVTVNPEFGSRAYPF